MGPEPKRLRVVGMGIAAGFGVSYAANSFVDYLMSHVSIPEDLPGIFLYVILILTPLAVIGVLLWIVARIEPGEGRPLNRSPALLDFATRFGIPFLVTYFVTCFVYWMSRV